MKNAIKSKAFKIIAVSLCAAIIFSIIAYDFHLGSSGEEKTFFVMGTVAKAKINGRNSAEVEEQIEDSIAGIEKACLSWRVEESDVWRINQAAGKDVSVSRESAEWISRALDICESSNGAFDITIGELTKLWNIGSEGASAPKEEKINEVLKSVGYQRTLVNATSVMCGEGQSIDLGSIGKGIACDIAYNILEESNIKNAVISIGGSVLVYGSKSALIGIIDPFNTSGTVGTLKLKGKCVSTSGDYERYFEQDGEVYHHILNPSTGYPTDNYLKSVTVICDSGLDSDALSTACYVMGYQKSKELLNKYKAQAVFIFKDKTIALTKGLEASFDLTNSDYVVEQ